jgi:hypothetical protein
MCFGRTDDWGRKFEAEGKKFRAIFIDGDHSYEWCKEDFQIWSPLLDKGGELIFHDCHVDGVNQVIEELGRGWKLKFHVLTTKVFERA